MIVDQAHGALVVGDRVGVGERLGGHLGRLAARRHGGLPVFPAGAAEMEGALGRRRSTCDFEPCGGEVQRGQAIVGDQRHDRLGHQRMRQAPRFRSEQARVGDTSGDTLQHVDVTTEQRCGRRAGGVGAEDRQG
ncbi:MAG TPA: hypothetical protein PLV68_08070, partial [Ilumatobacteraceae bacterium]|nr:hypothetical protein [Ilumatobacteraceae bacterium]